MFKTCVRLALLGFLVAACSSGKGTTCKTDNDCPPGRYCRPDGCAYDCTYDSDCPPTFRCGIHGQCEAGCVKTNHGVEACDGIDNDCDSLTDEDFPDLGKPCQNGSCPPGVFVCKKDGTGVECNGRFPAADDSTCDGIDDDCDGLTDEDALPRPCPLQQGVCAGAMTHCVNGAWTACDYGPDYEKDVETRCDGLDNNCDGSTDEGTLPSLEPESGAQAKDGKDNNCNGLADEPGGVNVKVPQINKVWIDSFEIGIFANADCTGMQYGVNSDDYPAEWPATADATVTLYACSLPGIVPSGYLSWYRAWRACVAQGKRLCTVAEWDSSCNNASLVQFPYGAAFVPGACNDAWGGVGHVVPTGSRADCTAGDGTLDMSGNLAEWVQDLSPDYPNAALVGGSSYQCELCDDGLLCVPCNKTSTTDLDKIKFASDCMLTGKHYETFPQADARAYLGGRCCMDGP